MRGVDPPERHDLRGRRAVPNRRHTPAGVLLRCGRSAAIAVALTAVAACGGAPATTASGSAPASAAPAPAEASPTAPPLARLFITSLPAGFVVQPDSVGDTGPSDLAKAARDDGKPDALSVLTRDGFSAGYQRLWVRPGGTSIVIFIYRFSDPAGAVDYLRRSVTTLMAGDRAASLRPLPVPDISGAAGFTGTVRGVPLDNIQYPRGDYLVMVDMVGAGATSQVAIQVAQDQLARLP